VLPKFDVSKLKPGLCIVIFMALFLASCADRNRTYKSNNTRYYVTSVAVYGTDPAGDAFARQLQFNLQNSIGSASEYFARKVNLFIQILPSSARDQSLSSLARKISSFGAASVSASVRVLDSETGDILEYQVLTASSTRDDAQTAYTSIGEDMIAQIRALLGLNLVSPHPVPNIAPQNKTYPMMSPGSQVNRMDVPSLPQRQADPLLNGQITPETTITDLMKQTKQVDEEMTDEAVQMKKMVIEQTEKMTDNAAAPKPEMSDEAEDFVKEVEMSKPEDTGVLKDDDGELCIVTVENDCLVQNGSN